VERVMLDVLKRYNFWNKDVTGCGVLRESYLRMLSQMESAKSIITVTGGRRVGKSVIVRQFIRRLIENGVDSKRIFYANLFIQDIDFLKDRKVFQQAIELWKNHFNFKKEERLFIVIDEVQEIANWELLISSLYEDYTTEYKIIITGSNAKLLSSELHTYLAGRSFELIVFPLSFEEYSHFLGREPSRKLCIEYLKKGGMPELLSVEESFARGNLVTSMIDSIVMRDIVLRHDIRNINLLKKIVDYFVASPSDEISKVRIKNLLTQGGQRISINTVTEYIEYLKEAFFIHECSLFSYKKGDILQRTPLKVYLNDSAFAQSSHGVSGFGKLLENVVYIDLLRR
jgi:predicted AAA+ superfamily ATPase